MRIILQLHASNFRNASSPSCSIIDGFEELDFFKTQTMIINVPNRYQTEELSEKRSMLKWTTIYVFEVTFWESIDIGSYDYFLLYIKSSDTSEKWKWQNWRRVQAKPSTVIKKEYQIKHGPEVPSRKHMHCASVQRANHTTDSATFMCQTNPISKYASFDVFILYSDVMRFVFFSHWKSNKYIENWIFPRHFYRRRKWKNAKNYCMTLKVQKCFCIVWETQ